MAVILCRLFFMLFCWLSKWYISIFLANKCFPLLVAKFNTSSFVLHVKSICRFTQTASYQQPNPLRIAEHANTAPSEGSQWGFSANLQYLQRNKYDDDVIVGTKFLHYLPTVRGISRHRGILEQRANNTNLYCCFVVSLNEHTFQWWGIFTLRWRHLNSLRPSDAYMRR